MKKMTKIVVLFLIIIGVMCNPINAALSQGDGSSFVTKAEFDSALGDFNARLTSFESGINSKIDSQVTSYLERNGIWKGAVVEEFEGKQFFITKVKADRANCYTSPRNYRDADMIWKTWDFEAKKDGLFVMSYNMVTDITDCSSSMCQLTYRGTGDTGAGRDANFYLWIDLYTPTYNRVYFKVYTNALGCNTNNTWIRVNYRGFSGTICTFVKKGLTYSFRCGDYWDYMNEVTIEMSERIPYPWYFDVPFARIY